MKYFCLLLALVALDGFCGLPGLSGGAPDSDDLVPRGAGATELFSTFGGRPFPAATIACQEFTDALVLGLAAFAADDFVVPAYVNRWIIGEIQVYGTYFNGPGPADSINIYIFQNDEGTDFPNSTDPLAAFYVSEGLSYLDRGFGDFTILLPGGGAVLPPGHYWICVQPVMAVGVGGQWGWTESSAVPDTGQIVGFESSWFQTHAAQQIPPGSCIDAWGRRISDCNMTDPNASTPLEYDLAVWLGGQEIITVAASATEPLILSETGTSRQFQVVLTQEPLDDVTIAVASGDPTEAQIGLLRPSGLMLSDGPLELTFTPTTWSTPQTLVLTGLADSIIDGDISFEVQFSPALSNDPEFNGIHPHNLTVINTEVSCFKGEIADSGNPVAPSVDGSGNLIAFASTGDFVGNNGDGNREIFIYNRQSGVFQQITNTLSGSSEQPSLDDLGQLLVFSSTAFGGTPEGNPSEVFLFDLTKMTQVQLSTSDGASMGATRPQISGNGSRVLFLSDGDPLGGNPDGSDEAFLYDIGTSSLLQVSFGVSVNVVDFSISGDAEVVLFTQLDGSLPLLRYRVTSGLTDTLLSGINRSPAINSDGSRIAVISFQDLIGQNPDGNPEVFVLDSQSGTLQVTHTTGSGFSTLVISDSGDLLAFSGESDPVGENGDGGSDLFLFDLDLLEFAQAGNGSATNQINGLALGNRRLVYSSGEPGEAVLSDAWFYDIRRYTAGWPVNPLITDLVARTCE